MNNQNNNDLKKLYENIKKLKFSISEEEFNNVCKEFFEKNPDKEKDFIDPEQLHIEEVTRMDLPLDWENSYQNDERVEGLHVDSIADGLIYSLTNLGKVDIEYIAAITSSTYQEVIKTLTGSIYQNPNTWNECFYKGWETSEEYLSGNLLAKLKIAKEANRKYQGYFKNNVKALEKIIPPSVSCNEIYVTIGSPWVPSDVIDDFILYLFGEPFIYSRDPKVRKNYMEKIRVIHDECTGIWEIPEKGRYDYIPKAINAYGTNRINPLYIIEKTLNMKSVVIYDETRDPNDQSKIKRIVNKTDTVAAVEKQKLIIKAFDKWIWQDETRKKRLQNIFEEKYGCIRKRIFDGSFLTFPGMSNEIKLYPYQKNAVARIIFTPNTLLAHNVGAGKTYVMIAAGQELKRMRLSQKNLYVVPNNIVGQWETIFKTMYPNAKLLIVSPKEFKPEKRLNVLKDIIDNDYDGIIMAYSCFSQIPVSKKHVLTKLEEEKERITNFINNIRYYSAKLEKRVKMLKDRIKKINIEISEAKNTIYFDELKITRLFVDEAHNFKNVPIETQTNDILGISKTGSKKCQDMLEKVELIQANNDGKGIVFATGTPITNSITDAYIMQLYLQKGELTLLDLQSFDSWIGMFAEKATEFEIDVDTSSYRLATRFSKFHNLPELTNLLASIADFHNVEQAEMPDFEGYQDITIPKTADFVSYLKEISERADRIRNRLVNRHEDNMLKITTDGRKAALDLRLVCPNLSYTENSKVAKCAEKVAEIYFDGATKQRTQLIFCDSSTPKENFNMYDELKRILVSYNIPGKEIAYIHDATTETKRMSLFTKVRQGHIRILIGSTFKLGLGVNVQDKLVAIHHLDVPWRPADMTQREGRILRQGNTNEKVAIYRYITEGSFDAYSWQILETKQHFISALLSGSLNERSGSDIENTVLNYAEVKALAIGNPLIKERVEAVNQLNRLLILQRQAVEKHERLEEEQLELPHQIAYQKGLINKCEEDVSFYKQYQLEHPKTDKKATKEEKEARTNLRQYFQDALDHNELKKTETEIFIHRGFHVVLPANMIKEKPYIWLSRSGKYIVELGDNKITGNLVRIENFLVDLPKYLATLKETLIKLNLRFTEVKNELTKKESYLDEIKQAQETVKLLDEKLGVDQNDGS